MTKPTYPLQSCRSRTQFRHSCSRFRYNCVVIFLKGLFLYPWATALERERESRNPVRKRQLCSGDVGFVTWRSLSYVIRFSFKIWIYTNPWGEYLIQSWKRSTSKMVTCPTFKWMHYGTSSNHNSDVDVYLYALIYIYEYVHYFTYVNIYITFICRYIYIHLHIQIYICIYDVRG